jgi:hypothetical protein
MQLDEFYRLPRLWQWGGLPVTRKVDGDDRTFAGDDCTTFIGSRVADRFGVDPAADLRGTYEGADEAAAVVARAGGIVALGDRRLGACGFQRVSSLLDDDIGIVEAVSGIDSAVKEVPAIRFGPLWIVMHLRGPMAKPLNWTGVAWRRP